MSATAIAVTGILMHTFSKCIAVTGIFMQTICKCKHCIKTVFIFTKCLHENASDSNTFAKFLHENALDSDDRSTHLGYLKSDLRSQGECNCHCCHGHSHAHILQMYRFHWHFHADILQMKHCIKQCLHLQNVYMKMPVTVFTFTKCLHENASDSDGSCTQPGFSSNFK